MALVAPPEEPMWGERRRWRVPGGPEVLPGCCVSAAGSGLPVSPPGPAPALPRGCGVWKSPRHRTLRPSRSCTPRGEGHWGLPWGAGMLPGPVQGRGQRERESSAVGPPWARACPSSCRARAALHPCPSLLSRVTVGQQGCSDLSPCPFVHGTASGNLWLVRSLFQAF